MEAVCLVGTSLLSWIVWPLLVGVGAMGLTAMFCPDTFAVIAQRGGSWVDTSELIEKLDERVDIDSHVLRYSRAFGLAVFAAATFLAYLYYSHLTGGAF